MGSCLFTTFIFLLFVGLFALAAPAGATWLVIGSLVAGILIVGGFIALIIAVIKWIANLF